MSGGVGSRRRRARVGAITAAGYAVLAVVFWRWRILAGAPPAGPIDAPTSDLYAQYLPVFSRAFMELRGGALPLWNPYQLAGVPTLPSWFTFGAFNPLNALRWILPSGQALGWSTCLHVAVAGLGMHWLGRSLGVAAPAAAFAGWLRLVERPALLVLADAALPGWSAEVDGAPAPIHLASRTRYKVARDHRARRRRIGPRDIGSGRDGRCARGAN